MTVVVDSDAFGGAETYAGHLLGAMPAGLRRSLVVSQPVAGHFRATACPVVVVPLARHRERAPAITQALRDLAPDAVLLNLVDPASNAAALQACTAVGPTVVTLHLAPPDGAGLAAMSGLYQRCAHVITVSAATRRALLACTAIPPERSAVVRNGVPIPPAVPPRAPGRPPLIAAVGRLTAQKGFDVLIEAVRVLGEQAARAGGAWVPARVVVAGDGRDRAFLAERARGLPVRFAGYLPDVGALLGSADLFCLPSRHEALPFALLEAMAYGLPGVVTDVGDVAAAVGGAALVVPPGDAVALAGALARLLADGGLRACLGGRARSRAATEFTAARMAAETAVILAGAARAGRAAAG